MTDTSELQNTAETPEAGELDPNLGRENLPDPGSDDTDQETGRQKGLRARAQQAEAERDTALALVDALRRAEIARLAADTLAVPSDLFTLGGVDVADLVDDDGHVDPEKVSEAVTALLETRPGLAVAELRKPPTGYQNSGQGQTPRWESESSATWGKLLSKK